MIRLLCFLALMFPIKALGQEALVRSGEHRDFTRLVIYLPSGTEWSLEQEGDSATLNVPEWDRGFNIASVFFRIPKTRIRNVVAQERALEIELGCDCVARAEALQNGPVVIDVQAVSEDQKEPTAVLPTVFPRRPELDIATPLDRAATSQQSDAVELGEFQNTLLRQIGQAASQSILDANVVDPSQLQKQAPPKESAPVAPKASVSVTPDVVLADQIRTRNASTSSRFASPGPDAQTSRRRCIPNKDLAFETWIGTSEFAVELAALRSELYEEFDSLDRTKALGLVRFYLSYALTDEARAVTLRLLSDDNQKKLLLELAGLVEDRVSDPGEFTDLHHCEGHARFWAFLADPDFEVSADLAKSLISDFSSLPIELRKAVGARVISRFIAAGLTTEASVLETELARFVPEAISSVKLTTGVSVDDLSSEDLEALVARNDDSSALALVNLMERTIAEDRVVTDATIEIAEAILTEIGDAPTAQDLRRSLVRAFARGGQVSKALNLHSKLELPLDERAELSDFILSEALNSENPSDLALTVLEVIDRGLVPDIRDENVQRVADSLVAMGLSELSEKFLAASPFFEISAETRALIALEDGSDADFGDLIKDPDLPDRLRAELALRSGQTSQLLLDSELPEDLRNQTVWEAKNYREYQGDDARSRAINHLFVTPIDPGQPPTLADATSLAQEAQLAANNIKALLAEK